MFDKNKYLLALANNTSEGLIYIDNKGIIELYNKKAKEIFGIIYNQGKGHKFGKINRGDIVIIGDNCIGKDDGNLTIKDLKMIGIDDKNIEENNSIIGVGIYGENGKGVYKYSSKNEYKSSIKLNTREFGKNISIIIDYIDKGKG